MIHSMLRFTLVLWEADRPSGDPGLKLQFETLAHAVAAFDEHRRDSRYREGVLFHWRKDSDDWEMIDRFRH